MIFSGAKPLVAHPQGVRFWAIRQADRFLAGPPAGFRQAVFHEGFHGGSGRR